MADFCRLLARDNTPIVSRESGPDYLLVRIQACNYAVGAGGKGRRIRRVAKARYPRAVYVGGQRYWVHSLEEERLLVQAHLAALRQKQAVELPPERVVKDRAIIRRNETRLRKIEAQVAKMKAIQEEDEIILLMVD